MSWLVRAYYLPMADKTPVRPNDMLAVSPRWGILRHQARLRSQGG